jgi:protein tyrosine/serine phosphatase
MIQIAPNIFRGSRPSDELSAVKISINLEVGWFEFWHQSAERERQACKKFGVIYYHLPMSDWAKPAIPQLEKVCRLMRNVSRVSPVLFHCLHGKDRTGIVAASYRIMYQGWAVEAAIEEMYALGFHRFPYWYWVKVLYKLQRGSAR